MKPFTQNEIDTSIAKMRDVLSGMPVASDPVDVALAHNAIELRCAITRWAMENMPGKTPKQIAIIVGSMLGGVLLEVAMTYGESEGEFVSIVAGGRASVDDWLNYKLKTAGPDDIRYVKIEEAN